MISQEEKIAAGPLLTVAERRAFLQLPLEERRKKLAEQAERMVEHYELEIDRAELEEWQGGDIVE
jgi:hypothetical protein